MKQTVLARSVLLLLAGLAFVQPVRAEHEVPSRRGTRSVVAFCCDFSHFPAMANMEFSHHGCDVTVAHDRHPHLRLLGPGSHLSLRFKLPDKPKAAVLEVVHLASAGPEGEGIAPVTVSVNGRPVVRDWNVGATTFTETRWPVGEMLQPSENQIEWVAGEIRTHYWLRAVRLYVEFDRPVEVAFPALEVGDELFLETRYSQCSYNALATVLDHFYGIEGWTEDRAAFEDGQFVTALRPSGLEPYYGWAPWTSYMVQSGRLRWAGQAVNDLAAERFALRTEEVPQPQGREMLVHYQPGERGRLVEALLSRLKEGPVILWTPYAAAMEGGGAGWRHVRPVGPDTDAVRFRSNVTHSVVVNREGGEVKVYDNSLPGGVFVVRPETVVATAAAMSGSIRVERAGGKTLLGDGLRGVEADEFHVVFRRR
jgi:hypothetical protein